MKTITVVVLFVTLFISSVSAWDTEELEIFDLVEEINENFYTLLGVQQDATLQEIKRAFRNLSIILHPDKSDAEDANVKFRNLVSVYEVLKDPGKREKYDAVLKNGLPNWKSALYYYRRVRKMGVLEMLLILFVIITIGQYFVSWAAYVEKKYTAEQLFGTKLKKLSKKNKGTVDIETILKEIPPPSIKNTLPFQIPLAIWYTPRAIKATYNMYADYKKEELARKEREVEEEERQKELQEEFLKEKESKTLRKRKPKPAAPEKTDADLVGYSNPLQKRLNKIPTNHSESKPVVAGGLWTDEDLADLVKLVKKFPGGTVDRWEIIAEAMNRTVAEVTFMAAKLKDNGYRIPGQTDSVAETIILETAKKVKTKKVDNQILVPETNWSQEQQQALETAIVKNPKGPSDRWLKISNSVPGKTKEECLIRYKYLVELVKKQKVKKDAENTKEDVEQEEEDEQEVNKVDKNNVNQEVVQEVDNDLPVIDMDEESIEEVEEMQSTRKAKRVQKKLTNKYEEDNDNEEITEIINKGKPKNKRRERRRQIDYSSEEESE